jgi:hypothetical protein
MDSSSTLTLALTLLAWRNAIKFYHWNTFSYARHVATCGFVATLDTAIDSIIEKYIARYGRPTFTQPQSIPVVPVTDADAISSMKSMAVFLERDFPKFVRKNDTDLINLRDDLLGSLHNLIYLFSLN